MPPPLATFLFLIFIGGLLLQNSRRSGTSPGLWLPTLSLVVMASKPIVYWMYGNKYVGDQGPLDGNPIDRSLLLVIGMLGVLILVRRGIRATAMVSANRALALLLLYSAMSVLWSVEPLVSFKRYIRELVHFVMLIIVLTDVKPAQAIRTVFLRCLYILVPLSVLVIKYYPESGRYFSKWTWASMYSGITTNKNSLGLLSMLGVLILLSAVMTQRGRHSGIERLGQLSVLVMSTWLLSIASSKTALACTLVGVVSLLVCHSSWLRARPTVVTSGTWAVAIMATVLLFSPITRGTFAEMLGRDATLTTRTDIWAAVLTLHTNPLFGAGFSSAWLDNAGKSLASELEIPHAHNGFLELYLHIGIIGVLLMLNVLFVATRNAAAALAAGADYGPFLVTICLIGLIYNLSEVTFFRDNALSFCFFIAAIRVTWVARVAGRSHPPSTLRPAPHWLAR